MARVTRVIRSTVSFSSFRLYLLTIFSLALFFAGAVQAQSFGDSLGFSPHWNWKRIETEHFRIDFPEELTDVAQKAGNYFEQAHAALSPLMQWEPRARAQVVLVDNTDLANGLATPVLRFGIVLMVTPPDAWFSTAYYEDWLKLLIIHEYTHFLNMDATRALWSPLRSVFGDVLLPNAIWPSWMLEGMAVYMETLLTGVGRGRSAYYDMVLRSAVAAGVFGTSGFVPLDRVNGTNPYFPGGETAYLFGYQLMNRAASRAVGPEAGAKVLGELSAESSRRVPFFINMNAENVTGASWYEHWKAWSEDSQRRVEYQLDRIRSKPVTKPRYLTDGAYQVLGSAASRDGKWLVFTMETYDKRMGLHLLDLDSGKMKRVADKRLGSQIAFTPDSRHVVFSSVEVQFVYSQFSDLSYYDVSRATVSPLSKGLRARDPDVSPDGGRIVFSLTQTARTGLATAELRDDGGKLLMGKPEVLYMPDQYDRVSNPRFSRDGETVYFSLHRNGKQGSDIVSLDLRTRQTRTLVADKSFNRFPAVSPVGDLYFVSDRTGVDNVYRFGANGRAELVTNLETGIYFPSFGTKEDVLYGSVFSHTGSNLAEMPVSKPAVEERAVSIQDPPAPAQLTSAPKATEPQERSFAVSDYSIFPSIWPRQWFPVLYLEPRNVYIGAQVLGFDAIDRHRYILGAAYNTVVSMPDFFAIYTNRSLGPTISFSAEHSTAAVYLQDPILDFVRQSRLSTVMSYPVRTTYSTLVPAIAAELERSNEYRRDGGEDILMYRSRYVPHLDLRLAYSNAEYSRLAVTAEGGREAFAGTRTYFDSRATIWKALLMDRENVRIWDHVVWSPSAKFTWTSQSSDHLEANALVRGRSLKLFDPLPSDNFDHLALRGYPRQPFFARAAGVVGQEVWFPVLRVFRGWGTNPAFLEQLSGFAFAEAAYFPGSDPGVTTLPAAGAGLKLDAQVFVQVPLTATLEYHHGFRGDFGGKSELFFTLALGAFSF